MGNGTAIAAKEESFLKRLIRTKAADSELEGHLEPHQGSDEGIEKIEHGALVRSMGVFPLTMIGVGATIGTGIFFTMVEAVPKAGPSVILSFLIAALTAGLTAFC